MGGGLRPPAVPLVACDPYFSIWSPADRLTDTRTVHWTGKPHRLTGLVRIDGSPYRFLGADPEDIPALPQTGLEVLPTRTLYTFRGPGIDLVLTWMTPALPDDLEVLARPVTYVDFRATATDARPHTVEVYLDASGEVAVDTPAQPVLGRIEQWDDLVAARIGSRDQAILERRGDDLRIDWGYLYLAAGQTPGLAVALGAPEVLRAAFLAGGAAASTAAAGGDPVPGGDLVGAIATAVRTDAERPGEAGFLLAYDDLYSIRYMGRNLRPYWRRNGWEAPDLLAASIRDHAELQQRCTAFDEELMNDLRRAGGEGYAQLCALAFRQCFAAGKFVADDNGQPLQFGKENHSNGCIATADVFYPMAPQFLLFGPTLTKAFLVPFMNYAASDRWAFPFAPHDLGTYPHAEGQRYGGGERDEKNQMPVEESGNLILLMAALARMEGHADFAGLYWPQLERWAAYLRSKGFDPENQLCTDDFAGHLAHNVNLSAKAICGLGAFAWLCELRGETALAAEYRTAAETFAERWVREAADGDHFRLAFDRPDTWSQKYNLVWDRILDLELFPEAVLRTEMAWYRKAQGPYGLPLDNRQAYTKLDWILWTATLTRDSDDFQALLAPVIRFLNETPDRVPMTDWYWTPNARRKGFTARPVVGGVFLRMLYDRATWRKYAKRERTHGHAWAPMPVPPRTRPLVPSSESAPAAWRYTTSTPPMDWTAPEFDAGAWAEGPGGFGTRGTPEAVVRTVWDRPEIWLRRTFELPQLPAQDLALRLHHDEDVEVFLNGMPVFRAVGYTTEYGTARLPDAARQACRQGRNVLAVHCRQTTGGQYIDVGIDTVLEEPPSGDRGLPLNGWLFAYFLGNGEDGLHLAWSADGMRWQVLGQGRSFLSPRVGGRLMRDPCLVRCPDGTFQMVWTTGWKGRDIGHASSKDLIHWSEQQAIPVMAHEPTAENCWAPEVFRDPETGEFLLYWSTTIPGRFPTQPDDHDHRLYGTTTRDFRTFTPTRLLFDPGYNIIDGTILPWRDRYVLIFKDERRQNPEMKNLRLAFASSPLGPWTGVTEPFTPPGLWVEGPSAIVLGDEAVVYFDCYRQGHYGAMASRDLTAWRDAAASLRMPLGARHGTIVSVPASVLRELLGARPPQGE
ncbi:MAG: DUF4965 domain-containing protein [Lentisphaeria bacterium]|nr:DUF4965 domain-containing protein [Lentisphaeria bacterium]